MFERIPRLLGVGAGCALMAGPVLAADITGAGATFPYPVLSKWSTDYSVLNGAKVNYQSIGSGGGIAQIKAGTVDFGASDKPLPPDELAQAGLAQFPIVIGKIQKWNDPAITGLNPGLKLGEAAISVVHRSDGSGTTFNFANYLSKVSEEWKSKVGEGTSIQWPVGVGGKGNEGVAEYVKQIKNSIGYVELAYALQSKMAWAAMKNRAGNFVGPSLETFQAAAASADWTKAKDFYLVITDAPGPNSWPIAASSFVLMYKQPKDVARSKTALETGQAQAKALDYVALPDALVKQIEAYWASTIK